jgi:hypothetical protein
MFTVSYEKCPNNASGGEVSFETREQALQKAKQWIDRGCTVRINQSDQLYMDHKAIKAHFKTQPSI